ncbi:hypothetical protein O6H91_11G025600 [Diphasiastrum complanatum]|uniref:Uncharacterized protein n=5 Tax=Diphasiastrum complanatum TaxID=34168 RepID=A0ACC2C775_DIPCM|nr:hypothetical protein O6H91_11G025600 [Diphasiastrum complanatum]KAJ7537875.1 hypothetical protein O6H91_11G025600 [Diphasiastrum complanatum]KAJ7537876.1 hypothetical protein O6H91_11G025600 [Diphasiastrum complanatum]KAJ7537877.1 hypothetical protein O6H91_11G025600 [Diphasiastrum complanatum]KAJ7537878.1 hypothetical protein O6H91_11G025600 [Diphasiastrum complanatum]
MGWVQIMGSKVGHLLPHSSDAATSRRDSDHYRPPDRTDHEERENQQNHHRRAISENARREEFRGPDTSSLSSFVLSFFSCSEAGVRCGDDQPINQKLDKGKSETLARSNSKRKFHSGRHQVAASASSQNLLKEPLENEVEKKRIISVYEDENREESDWHAVSQNDVEDIVRTDSEAHGQKPESIRVLKLPLMSETSSLLSEVLQQSILPALPTLVRDRQWTMLYSTRKHGISLLTLYRRSSILPGPCLLVTGDAKGAVLGGLLSAPLKPTPKKKYQGTSETFVFTNVSGEPVLYRPTGANRYFVLCTNDALALGGGGHFALHLDGDLLMGSSGSCATFGNTPLAHSEEFIVKDVELWGFTHSSKYVPRQASFEESKEVPGISGW